LKTILDLSIERISKIDVFKGEHLVHYLTGPGVFTDGIISYLKSQNNKILDNIYEYEKLKCDIQIFNLKRFHNHYIHHLFSGMWETGWTKERDRLLL